MTVSMQRLKANQPARMQTRPAQHDLAHPRCALQILSPDDLEQTMCDAVYDDPEKWLAHTDAATFRLQAEFIRSHGAPKGEVTTVFGMGLFGTGLSGMGDMTGAVARRRNAPSA